MYEGMPRLIQLCTLLAPDLGSSLRIFATAVGPPSCLMMSASVMCSITQHVCIFVNHAQHGYTLFVHNVLTRWR